MNHGPLLFLGVFFAMAASWCGLVLAPQLQLGSQGAVPAKGSQLYPSPRPGLANQGKEVYRANGCYYCHTQQVVPRTAGADIERAWGKRYNVAQDYLVDQPVMLGHLRTGPDLANIGLRLPDDETRTNFVWHLKHLYNPRVTSPGSIMPSYPFLFEKRPLMRGKRSEDSLELTGQLAPESGFEIVPRFEAKALVAYLFSLGAETPLFESPIPAPASAAGDTNAPPAAGTNTPASTATNAPRK